MMIRSRKHGWLWWLVCVWWSAQAMAQDLDPAAIRAAVEKQNAGFLNALKQGDAESGASYFTEDAFRMFPGTTLTQGRDAIIQKLKETLTLVRVVDGSIETLQVEASGNMAYERGRFRYHLQPPGGKVDIITGQYVIIWERQSDGVWLIKGDIGSPD